MKLTPLTREAWTFRLLAAHEGTNTCVAEVRFVPEKAVNTSVWEGQVAPPNAVTKQSHRIPWHQGDRRSQVAVGSVYWGGEARVEYLKHGTVTPGIHDLVIADIGNTVMIDYTVDLVEPDDKDRNMVDARLFRQLAADASGSDIAFYEVRTTNPYILVTTHHRLTLAEAILAESIESIVRLSKRLGNLEHAGTKGLLREALVESVICPMLVPPYRAASGVVVDCTGQQSGQCDIIIWDDSIF